MAYYEGKKIASTEKLEELLGMRSIRRFLGEKEFLIRYLNLGRAEVVFRGAVGLLKKE